MRRRAAWAATQSSAPGSEGPKKLRAAAQSFSRTCDVEDDVDLCVRAGGFCLDQVELVAGAVDQDDPVAPVFGVAGFCLVESLAYDRLGVLLDGAGKPLVWGPGSGAGRRFPVRPPGGAMTSCGRRTAGSVS